jgi:hypothetical protein
MTENEKFDYMAWLGGLLVDDEVCIEEHWYTETSYIITKIKSITPKRWIKTERFQDIAFKEGKWWSHNKFDSKYRKLLPITQKVLDEIKYKNAIQHIANLNYHKHSRDKILAIYDIVKDE